MKRLVFLFLTACALQVSGEECFPEDRCIDLCGFDIGASLDIGAGYRYDRLKWAFPGFSPGVAIHETWDDVDIGYIQANGRVVACQTYVCRYDFDYGWSGWENRQHAKWIDYNSHTETFRETAKTKGEVYDVSSGWGKMFYFDCFQSTLAPFVGWSYNHQRFKNKAYYGGKHHPSKYSWNGPWIGFEYAYQLCSPCQIYLDYAFHMGRFHTTIDEFFRDHKHKNLFYGHEVEFGTVGELCADWFFAIKFNWKEYWTQPKHTANATFDDKGHPKRAEWNSFSIGVDLGYCF